MQALRGCSRRKLYVSFFNVIVLASKNCIIFSFNRAKMNEVHKEIDKTETAEEGKEGSKTGKTMARKKSGRRGQWTCYLLDDFVDISVNNETYKEKLIFRNTKYQQNGMLYDCILRDLKRRADARGDVVKFTVAQLRNKVKKCVSDCKKAVLTIKTATGVKRFQNERGFGVWFDHLFALIKTRESCNPEKATEPSLNKHEDLEGSVDT